LDAEGKFKISTVKHGDGVQPGDYAVVIISRAGTRTIDAVEGDVTSTIPDVYSSITTTPLKATISADAQSPVQVNFELTE
jgi:hypothetical protein